MKRERLRAILFALLAAVFYALNMPASKWLLTDSSPTMMAAFLYLGAGFGMGLLYLLPSQRRAADKLCRSDWPYTVGMIVLDIAAPILLMLGLTTASASQASLLNNFEIVATALIAMLLFRERITLRLWGGILLITLSSVLLTLEEGQGLSFSHGSLLVLAATCCWGLENNCTRQIAQKNTVEIVMIKGLCSGTGSLLIAWLIGEPLPSVSRLLGILLLGFVAYGLSIFFYIRAQKTLGAAKTSAYYAVSPFVGALLSFGLLQEPLTTQYAVAWLVMIGGSLLVVRDTLQADPPRQG